MATQAEKLAAMEEDLEGLSQQVDSFAARMDVLEEEFRRWKLAISQAIRLEFRE